MFVLSYQQKARLRRIAKIAGIVIGVLLLLCLIRFLYLGRFIVYDSDGAHLRYDVTSSGAATSDADTSDFTLVQERSQSAADAAAANLRGIYLTASQTADRAALKNAERELTHVSAMMLTVKTSTGTFNYPTALEDTAVNDDTADAFLHLLQLAKQQDVYLIAALPAFADRANAEAYHTQSLQIRGGALWLNADGSYCLDPREDHTRDYLLAQIAELRSLGFREVWLTGFDFPSSPYIVLETDADTSLQGLAKALRDEQGKDPIRVSFETDEDACAELSDHHYLILRESLESFWEDDPILDPQDVLLTVDQPETRTDFNYLAPLP